MYESKSQMIKSMLSDIESKLKIQTSSKTTENYFNKSAKDNNFQNPNYDTNDKKFNLQSRTSNGQSSFFDSKGISNSNEKVANIIIYYQEFEIKKFLDKELENYLFTIKTELKYTIENFYREIGEFKFIKNEINLIKQSTVDNKKLVLIFQDDFEKKINELNLRNYNSNTLFDSTRISLEENQKKMKSFEERINNYLASSNSLDINKFSNSSSDIKNLTERISLIENQIDLNKSISSEIKILNEKIKEMDKANKLALDNITLKSQKELDNKYTPIIKNLSSFDEKLSKLESENKNDKKHIEDWKRLCDEFEKFKSEINEKNKQTEKSFKKLNESNEEILKLNSNFDLNLKEVKQNLNNFEEKFSGFEKNSKKLTELNNEFDSFKDDYDSKKSNLEEVINNNHNYQENKINDLTKQFLEINKEFNNINSDFNEKIKSLDLELKKFVEKSIKSEENSINTINNISLNIKSIEKKISSLPEFTSEVKRIHKNIEDLNENNENLVENSNDTNEKIMELQNNFNDLFEKLENIQTNSKIEIEQIKFSNNNFNEKLKENAEEMINIKLDNIHEELKIEISRNVSEELKK